MRPLLLWTFPLALVSALCLTAQQTSTPDTPVATLHAETNLVVLDVIVHERHGLSIKGLTREDFTVLEDGKPQKILNFEEDAATTDFPAAPTFDYSGHPDWGSAPLTIVVIDELTTSFEAMAYGRFELERYLKRQPVLLDTPIELLAVNDRGFEPIEPYTRERDLLLKRLHDRRVGLPSALFRGDIDELVGGALTAVRQIALASEGERDERKNLIWIGSGFPAVSLNRIPDRSRAVVESIVRDTTTSLLKARIVVYVIDPEGVRAYSQPQLLDLRNRDPFTAIGLADERHPPHFDENQIALGSFASQTGGGSFFSRNDVDAAVASSVNELRSSYALSYSPENLKRDGKYRKIKVSVNRPDVTVQTRDGYFAPGGRLMLIPQKESEFDTTVAASNSLYYSGINASITSLSLAPGKRPVTLSITVRVEMKGLQWNFQPDGSAKTSFTLAAVSQNNARKIIGSTVRQFAVTIPASKAELTFRGSLDVSTELLMSQKADRLRVLVHDSAGHLGSADADPDTLAKMRAHSAASESQRAPKR